MVLPMLNCPIQSLLYYIFFIWQPLSPLSVEPSKVMQKYTVQWYQKRHGNGDLSSASGALTLRGVGNKLFIISKKRPNKAETGKTLGVLLLYYSNGYVLRLHKRKAQNGLAV